MCIHHYLFIYLFIYIYINRERERDVYFYRSFVAKLQLPVPRGDCARPDSDRCDIRRLYSIIQYSIIV